VARVSIVIPCHNHARYLTTAVRSVLAQTYRDWQIVVVDDGSTDGTDRVVDHLMTWVGKSLAVVTQDQAGVSAARNAGMRIADGAFVLPLDADDTIAPRMLQQSLDLLDSRKELAIAYTDGVAFARGNRPRAIRMPDWDPGRLLDQNGLAACSLYRRQVWEEVGGYDITMPAYEDWDFWLGCVEHGFTAGHIPELLFGYRVGNGGRHAEGLRRDLELRARIVCNHSTLFGPATVAWATALTEEYIPSRHELPDEMLARNDAIRALAASRDALAVTQRERSRRTYPRRVAGRREPAWLT
jgi:glycosyltransferase involved in cell wall biosynthesis